MATLREDLIKKIGEANLRKIERVRIGLAGAGGLGSPALYYLAAAGVGTLGISDKDTVELSNLNRQIIHFTEDLKKEKKIKRSKQSSIQGSPYCETEAEAEPQWSLAGATSSVPNLTLPPSK